MHRKWSQCFATKKKQRVVTLWNYDPLRRFAVVCDSSQTTPSAEERNRTEPVFKGFFKIFQKALRVALLLGVLTSDFVQCVEM